ncbi:MAG: ParB/RepB/Spo0J family partition protein [Patescibacteria group bacterium]
MSQPYSNSIFWIDVEKIKPNPYQPRREFDPEKLKELADSIRQYGILQPLVVTRREIEKSEGGLAVEYELIAGERRLRASKLAGIAQVPVLIRVGDDAKMKLELAIIENLQREDLNPVDRAKAFDRLAKEFGFKHAEIGRKVGKSREYVSNTMRLLTLPERMLTSLSEGKISEGHTRPLMMLVDRLEEQEKLYQEILGRKMTVREAEGIARRIAQDRARKKERMFDPAILNMEKNLAETLGTRVQIEKNEKGGKITIDFFSDGDLETIVNTIRAREAAAAVSPAPAVFNEEVSEALISEPPMDDRPEEEIKKEENEDIYNVKNFSI